MRAQIATPKLGSLSQGTIFSCATAEDYADCDVHGIIITARCDIAQSKAPNFNYLPVVSLDDWIHRDGKIILCERIYRDVVGKMKNLLKSNGYSTSVLLTESPRTILNKLFADSTEHLKKSAESKQRFEQLVTDFESVVACRESNAKKGSITSVGKKHLGTRDTVIRELGTQRLNGHYFLPSLAVDGDNLGYVILLRQVQHIPRELAGLIGRGLDFDEYAAREKSDSGFSNRLSFKGQDFAMPVGQLTSPQVEHLMQAFSALFSRIGLPDPDPEYLSGIWDLQPSIKKDAP